MGRVKTNEKVPNQCKIEGHKAYDYLVALIVPSTNLDAHKFVLDHVIIHEMVSQIIENHMGSCEEICLRISERLNDFLPANNIHVMDIYIKISPVLRGNPKNRAFMEYSQTGNFSAV